MSNMQNITIISIQPPFPNGKNLSASQHSVTEGLKLLKRSLEFKPTFCLLPEYFNTFGLENNEMRKVAVKWCVIYDEIVCMAKKYNSYIILPLLVEDNGKFYNRTFIIDDKGELLDYYDKTHLTITEIETLKLTAGNKLKCIETPYGKIAIAVCYEIYFPEIFSTLASYSPDMIFLPSLQRSEYEPSSEVLLKARAMDTQAYIVRSSYGQQVEHPWDKACMFGQSCVIHPDGTMLANAGHYAGIAIAEIPFPFTWRKRRCAEYGFVPVKKYLSEDRRPELYL